MPAEPCQPHPGLALARKSQSWVAQRGHPGLPGHQHSPQNSGCSLAAPRAPSQAQGRLWEHRSPPRGTLLRQGMSPCMESPPRGHSQSSAQPLGALSCPLAGFPSLGCGFEARPPRAGGVSPRPQGGEAMLDPHKHPAAGTGVSSPRAHSGKGLRGLQDSPWIPWNAQQGHCAPHSYRNST